MFETATIPYGPASKRVWTTCLGMTGQTALVGLAILIPLMFPAALPRPQSLMTWIEAPAPPPPPPPPGNPTDPAPRRVARLMNLDGTVFIPPKIPTMIPMIEDPPIPIAGSGVIGGMTGGDPNGDPGGVLGTIIRGIPHMPASALAPRPAPVPVSPAAAAAPIPRYRVGGVVKEAVIVRRIEPVYPAIAVRLRVSGEVRLEGVIGTDGRIRELKVLSGNPLLFPAAVQAVSQWLYRPTTLNGEPVEVVAPITVTFKLN